MKRATKVGYLLVGLFFATYSAGFAQMENLTKNNIDAGLGLAYGSQAEQLGINVNAYIVLDPKFRVGGGLTYYFPEDVGAADENWFAINFNGQYLFYDEEYRLYGLAGLNIAIVGVNFDSSEFDDISETYLGLNVGAGIEYNINLADLFGELKITGVGNDADQLVLTAGVRFDI
ncbi:MAG TPA: hypothetical protein VFG39_03800 [Balneolaceae bacterium]|nr:hypothetical protein [Balneolaceae bacterium]